MMVCPQPKEIVCQPSQPQHHIDPETDVEGAKWLKDMVQTKVLIKKIEGIT